MSVGIADVEISNLQWWIDRDIEDWRNLALIFGASIGLPLATWRSWVAHKQALAAQTQVKLAEAGQNIDRYQNGAKMLGDDLISVRQAGFFGLKHLVEADEKTYSEVVVELLASFIRDRSAQQDTTDLVNTFEEPISADCQTAMTVILTTRANMGSKL
ncbi:MAG: hypothetical protein GY743_10290 [Planctomycetaceae bacterium]|nr:hypothetical protein [Planctomycetaceae bacterium]